MHKDSDTTSHLAGKTVASDAFHLLDIKPTAQRYQIAALSLGQQRQPLGRVLADESGNSVSKATAYNTLKLFLKKGLMQQAIIESSRIVYHSNHAYHYHFYTEDTGETHDLNQIACSFIPCLTMPDNAFATTGIDVVCSGQ